MILSYTFPQFETRILSGEKKHSLRADPKDRWKKGMRIHHWMGSPRNTRGKQKPYCFCEGECEGVQYVIIQNDRGFPRIAVRDTKDQSWQEQLTFDEVETLIKNDGLTLEEFVKYFVPKHGDSWTGKIIHFTDLKY